jgi:hypothetical protein
MAAIMREPQPPAAQELRLEELVDAYLADCRRRGLSARTVDVGYGYPLRGLFLPWCGERGVTCLSEYDFCMAQAFDRDLRVRLKRDGAPRTVQTLHAYVRPLRQFLNWCERRGHEVRGKPALPSLRTPTLHEGIGESGSRV